MARKHSPILINGLEIPIDAPGFRIIARPNGAREAYWYAPKNAVKAGYKPAVARLHGDLNSELSLHEMFKRCHALWNDCRVWQGTGGVKPLEYDGTFESLGELYQQDPRSPFHELRHNTKVGYIKWIRSL